MTSRSGSAQSLSSCLKATLSSSSHTSFSSNLPNSKFGLDEEDDRQVDKPADAEEGIDVNDNGDSVEDFLASA
jgi:hypothetical protein